MTKAILYSGDTFTLHGYEFLVTIEHDRDCDAPWDHSEGHGPVSDWTSREKKPGEWVLSKDRGSRRYYDAAEANRIARRDGWGLCDKKMAVLTQRLGRTPTTGEIRAEAVRVDFEHLRAWCNDEWDYVGVCINHINGDDDRYNHSLWGIESNDQQYLTYVAYELAKEYIAEMERV